MSRRCKSRSFLSGINLLAGTNGEYEQGTAQETTVSQSSLQGHYALCFRTGNANLARLIGRLDPEVSSRAQARIQLGFIIYVLIPVIWVAGALSGERGGSAGTKGRAGVTG